jgi:spoIIIJ-associated protein
MIKSIETTGRTEEDAISAALTQLGKTRDEVSVELLERGKTGFLGIGAVLAKVRVSYEEQDSKVTELETFLNGLFDRMGIEATIKSELNEEDNTISVELSGAHVGALIGRRGETLDAIQHLSNYVINNGGGERTRVNIDAENYRAKRADALTHLAKKVAAKVVKNRRSVTLEAMNAYERHVIHTALQDFDGVTTYSTGAEPNRRVVVAYERPGTTTQRDSAPRTSSRPASRPAPSAPQSAPEEPAKPAVDRTTREWH